MFGKKQKSAKSVKKHLPWEKDGKTALIRWFIVVHDVLKIDNRLRFLIFHHIVPTIVYLFTYIFFMSVVFWSLCWYLAGIVVFLILDAIMISQVILPMFRRHVWYLMGDVDMMAAMIFYLCYIGILYFIAVQPYLSAWHSHDVLKMGALFGFGAYLTYELTSKSFTKGWSYEMVIVDSLWGMILTAITAWVMWSVAHMLIK